MPDNENQEKKKHEDTTVKLHLTFEEAIRKLARQPQRGSARQGTGQPPKASGE
jgi:hypothetical protein